MKNKLLKACGGVILALMVLASASCAHYGNNYHTVKVINHTGRPIFESSIQLKGTLYSSGHAPAHSEGGTQFIDVRWMPSKAVFTWAWGDGIDFKDNVQEVSIPPYPEIDNVNKVSSKRLRIHVFPDDRIEMELAVTYYDSDNILQGRSLYEGPKKIGWWWDR